MLNSDFNPVAAYPRPIGDEDDRDEVGRGLSRDPRFLAAPPASGMPGRAFEIGSGGLQRAARLAPPVYDRPAGRDQRQHYYQAEPDAKPRDDAKVADHADGREQGGQQTDDGSDRRQRQRDRDVSQSRPVTALSDGLALRRAARGSARLAWIA